MQTHPEVRTNATRPFLKWAGGKQRLIAQLTPLLPPGNRLIEPFVGAGSVFLSTNYDSYLLNDANADLMSVWRIVKSQPVQLWQGASKYFTEEYRSPAGFQELRERFNRTSDAFERAALMLYLNRFAFNGIYRVNSKGEFNTPYAHLKVLPTLNLDVLQAASKRVQHAQLTCGDFADAIEHAGEGDVVYCDPPYSDSEEAPSFVGYTSSRFDHEEHRRLVSCSAAAVRRGATVLISNHDTPETRRLYSGWEHYQLEARRSVSADPARRGMAKELVAVLRKRLVLVNWPVK